jgi:pilus assembly protein CpaB
MVAAVAAIILAIVGTIGMVAYVNGAEERAASGEALAEVFIVDRRVPPGTAAERLEDFTTPDSVPQKLVTRDTIGDLEDVAGLVTEVALLPGEVLSTARFIDPVVFERDAGRIVDRPPGAQEVTLALDVARAGGGLIVPGDLVGVIISFNPFAIESVLPLEVDNQVLPPDSSTNTTTFQALHKILVTNVQLEDVPQIVEREGLADEEDEKIRLVPSGNLLITLAVQVNQAERLIFGAEFGSIWLTNEAEDTLEDPSIIQNRGTVYQDIEEVLEQLPDPVLSVGDQ